MRYQLDLTLRRAEGALTRVLGAAERRGFQPLSVDGEAQPDGDRWYLRMTVEGERSDDSLRAQLAKLYDCLSVEVSPCP
ncbi:MULTISPECIES: ACT domain-containing protein [Luteimonas]|uniref:ACT domain-containing protein n=1 Tax=Luteimonas salinilitoris TaxID=3237697 RepID=A0ABV4HQ31_9GAMM|nr:ACT domain-containing protein [Luteimonas suaedae]